jgi:predicted thioredoxin/glutaredoxin
MKTIDVFVESYCSACVSVVRMLRKLAANSALELRIYHRSSDASEFVARRVFITPATFIDSRLAFYGEFSEGDLKRTIETQLTNQSSTKKGV